MAPPDTGSGVQTGARSQADWDTASRVPGARISDPRAPPRVCPQLTRVWGDTMPWNLTQPQKARGSPLHPDTELKSEKCKGQDRIQTWEVGSM